jgi:hypothetical protein
VIIPRESIVRPHFEPLGTDSLVGQSCKPSRYLPFYQNNNFIGRTYEIDALEQKLFVNQDCREIAIVGLGGVGKTQVALQFAYWVLEKHPDVSVFWMHALSPETFEQGCREVAGVLEVLDAENGEEDVKEAVQRHLSKKRAGKWMLVVDNADDMEILEGSDGEKGILDYLPNSESGLTLFTTRDKKTAQALSGNGIVNVEKLDPATASELFKKMLTREDLLYEETTVGRLLVELDFLPLAITQAAAYINVNPVSINEYLGHLSGTESNLVYIMSGGIGDRRRYKQAAHAVAKTWLVSFDQIARQNQDAAELLQYMSCIEWKAIPRSILPALEPEARTTNAIGTLWSYSFITSRSDGRTYDMHQLAHAVARVWVHQKGLMLETQRRALEHLSNIFPSDDYENREIWRGYMLHAARIRNFQDESHVDAREKLCLKVGRCLRVDGRIRDAATWLEESRDLRRSLPEDHDGRLLSQHELTSAYQANGKVEEAVTLLDHVVAIHKRVQVDDHSDRLASQGMLASAYKADRRPDQLESRPLSQVAEHEAGCLVETRSTAGPKETLTRRSQIIGAPVHNGPSHPDTTAVPYFREQWHAEEFPDSSAGAGTGGHGAGSVGMVDSLGAGRQDATKDGSIWNQPQFLWLL